MLNVLSRFEDKLVSICAQIETTVILCVQKKTAAAEAYCLFFLF